jgi:hypothetical protein
MNFRIALSVLLGLAIFTSGLAVAQETFGTKVKSGDPDIGLPLSQLAAIPIPAPAPLTTQNIPFISYWDVGATPGIYDDLDVIYLQLGSIGGGALRIVRANNIRLTGWGNYPAGSYVNPGDSDMGQQLFPLAGVALPTSFASLGATGFHYMNVVGSAGYDIGDPVYLKTVASVPPAFTNTNDIRITANAGFPAGSRVSLDDPDAARPLLPFDMIAPWTAAGGNILHNEAVFTGLPIARLSFYNANGNVMAPSSAIYDTGDFVYFDVTPLDIVSPNDVRLF